MVEGITHNRVVPSLFWKLFVNLRIKHFVYEKISPTNYAIVADERNGDTSRG